MQLRICPHCRRQNRTEAHYCATCGRRLFDTAVPVTTVQRQLLPGVALGAEGRYQIQKLIGSGSFGAAYLAEDLRLRRLCLVKRLSVQATAGDIDTQAVRTNFEREARLLVELNHPGHPNIPEIYEYLPEAQSLVMKYISGQNLEHVLKRRTNPLPETEALRYIRDACAALDYMHTHKAGPILHRDLKPSNIMLDERGRVWLIDFGLARSTPIAHVPTPLPSTNSAGTYGYTPQEQWEGKPVPKSDIFALGATLYALVANRTPTPQQPAGEVLPVRQVNPTIRREVEELILRCMARNLVERPTAAELLVLLDDLLASANIPLPSEPTRPPDAAMVIGRDPDLQALAQRLHATRFVVVLGMPGVGKTTLAAALSRQYPDPRTVFWHRFLPGEGADRLLARLAGWLAHRDYPAVWQQLHRNRQTGQSVEPERIAEFLGQSPGMRGSLLCFDDLHIVVEDPAVQRVIERLRAAVGNNGSSIILTSRTLPWFLDASDALRLQGLRPPDSQALLVYRGLNLGSQNLEQLWQVTEGNPQFLLLASDALRQVRDPQQLLDHLINADRIEQYLLHEIDTHLSDAERAVMCAMAVLRGYGGTRTVIEAVLGDMSVRRELAALVSRQLLMVEHQEQSLVYHQHAMVQGFYYDLQSVRERRQLHQRAGSYYETEELDRLRAAQHYSWANDTMRAIHVLTSAPWELFNQGQAGGVDELLSTFATVALSPDLRVALWTVQGEAAVLLGKNAEARTLLEQAMVVAIDEPSVRRARRYRLLARLYAQNSEYIQAETSCRHGLALAKQPDGATARTEEARLYAQLAEILMRRDDLTGAMAACHAGLDVLPPEPATPAERAELLQRLATLEGITGEYSSALPALEHSLHVARLSGDRALTARVLHNLGHFSYHSGRLDAALPYLTESCRLKEQLGDAASMVDTLSTIGLVYLARGDQTSALTYYQRAYSLAEQYHQRTSMALVLHNIGEAQYEAGDLEAANASLIAADALLDEVGETSERAHCRYLLGDVALARNDATNALAYGRQALELAQQAGRQPLEACAWRVIGEAWLAQSAIAEADSAIHRAWALAESIGDPYDQALVLAARARLAYVSGRLTDARRDAQQSLELAHHQHIVYLATTMQSLIRRIDMDSGLSAQAALEV